MRNTKFTRALQPGPRDARGRRGRRRTRSRTRKTPGKAKQQIGASIVPRTHRLRGSREREKQREPGRESYLTVRLLETLRASGLFGVQSSGGKATRQKVGRGAENSRPISALPLRTGPRNATWHSCSSSVLPCRM